MSKTSDKVIHGWQMIGPWPIPSGLTVVYNLRQANIGLGVLGLMSVSLFASASSTSMANVLDWIYLYIPTISSLAMLLVGGCLSFRGRRAWRLAVIAEVVAAISLLVLSGYVLYFHDYSGNDGPTGAFFASLNGAFVGVTGLVPLLGIRYLLMPHVRNVVYVRANPYAQTREETGILEKELH